MNWKDELKTVAEINQRNPVANLYNLSYYKATQEVRKLLVALIEKFNSAKIILEADWTEVDIEKSNPERDRYICSLCIKSSKHENFKYSLILEVKNDNTFVISKEYIEGWVINGPMEVKKVNINNHWNENTIKILVNKAMEDLTNSYKLVCQQIK